MSTAFRARQLLEALQIPWRNLGLVAWTLGFGILQPGILARAGEGASSPPAITLNLEPVLYACDPGPETLIGTEKGFAQGERFLWCGITMEGGTPACRLYFDRLDNENFHFLDRREAALTLGLCEAGIELVLARASLNLRLFLLSA